MALTESSATTANEADVSATALGGAGEAAVETTDTGATALGGEVEAAETAEVAAPVVPEAYELTAPEGLTLSPADIEAATPVFKEIGLSNEQANKLMPVAAAFAQRIVDQGNATILAQVQADRKAWLTEAQADPEIGGAKWSDTIATGAKALDQLGFTKGHPFRVLLNESGLGNHPDMIRAFNKVGKAIGEDGFVPGNGAAVVKQDQAQILYPNDQPKGGN